MLCNTAQAPTSYHRHPGFFIARCPTVSPPPLTNQRSPGPAGPAAICRCPDWSNLNQNPKKKTRRAFIAQGLTNIPGHRPPLSMQG